MVVGKIRVMAKSMEVRRLEKEVLIHMESIILLSPVRTNAEVTICSADRGEGDAAWDPGGALMWLGCSPYGECLHVLLPDSVVPGLA